MRERERERERRREGECVENDKNTITCRERERDLQSSFNFFTKTFYLLKNRLNRINIIKSKNVVFKVH